MPKKSRPRSFHSFSTEDLLDRLRSAFNVNNDERHLEYTTNAKGSYNYQDIKADLLQQIGAVDKHTFYRRDTFLNEQKHEEWMQTEEKRMQKIIKRIYRLSESLNSEDLSLSQSMDHDITDDIIDRVEEEQRNRMMNPFKPDTTVPPFFPAGKRYELLFNTLTAFDEANVLGQQGRVLKLNKYLDLLSEQLDKLSNDAPFDAEAILNKEENTGSDGYEWESIFFNQSPFTLWLLKEFASRFGISPIYQNLTALNHAFSRLECKFDKLVVLHIVLKRTWSSFKRNLYSLKEIESFRDLVEKICDDINHYLCNMFRYFDAEDLTPFKMCLKVLVTLMDCGKVLRLPTDVMKYEAFAHQVHHCTEIAIRARYRDLLFSCEEERNFVVVQTLAEYSNDASGNDATRPDDDVKEKEREDRKEKEKDKRKDKEVLYDKEQNGTSQNGNVAVDAVSITGETKISPSLSSSFASADSEEEPSMSEAYWARNTAGFSDPNAPSEAQPITFGKRLVARGERKLSPKQMMALCDAVLKDFEAIKPFHQLLRRTGIELEDIFRKLFTAFLYQDIRLYVSKYARWFSAKSVLESGLTIKEMSLSLQKYLPEFEGYPIPNLFGQFADRWIREVEDSWKMWVNKTCRNEKWRPMFADEANKRYNSISVDKFFAKVDKAMAFLRSIVKNKLVDGNEEEIKGMHFIFGRAVCHVANRYTENVFNLFLGDFPSEIELNFAEIYFNRLNFDGTIPALDGDDKKVKRKKSSLFNSGDHGLSSSGEKPNKLARRNSSPSVRTKEDFLEDPNQADEVRDHGVIRLWALEMVKPIGILTPKRARKMLKKGRAVQIVMQSLVKLNSLYEFLKQLERVSADSLMELWSDNSKKLIALLQRITQSMVNMFVHLLLITSKAEIENIFVKGYHKTPKRFHKAVDAVAIYLISQFEVLRKFTATTCFDMIMIPFWKSTVSYLKEAVSKGSDDIAIEDILKVIKSCLAVVIPENHQALNQPALQKDIDDALEGYKKLRPNPELSYYNEGKNAVGGLTDSIDASDDGAESPKRSVSPSLRKSQDKSKKDMIKIRLGWRKRSTSVYGDEKFEKKKINSKKDKRKSELDGSLEGSHSDLDAIKDTSDKSSDDSESPGPHLSNNTPPSSSPLDASDNAIHNVSSPSSPVRKDNDKKKKEKEKEKEKKKK
jgi:hypothetical protein